jgi:tight adherence protein C
MEFLLAALLFILIAAMMSVAGMRLWARPKAAMERVTGTRADPRQDMPVHPSLALRDLIRRLGAMLPASAKDVGITHRRLIRAGFRSPNAIRLLYGVKLLLAMLLPLGTSLLMAGWEASTEVKAIIVAAAATLGFAGPSSFVRMKAKRRQRRILRGLPDALDLLVICVESGLGLDQAILQAAKELELTHRDISDEFALVNLELKAGKRRVEALRNLADRTAVEELKKLVAVLIQADRFGTSMAQSLRTHSEYMRVQSRQQAEEKAAKLGVKLVFPIFFCILPTLFVVTVGPVTVRIIRELLPMMENL